MKAILRHPLRFTRRALWLGGEVLLSLRGLAASAAQPRQGPIEIPRARAVQIHARRLLRSIGATVTVQGPAPVHGLLVANHLSYLDIAVLGSITPAVFVARSDVQSWPVFGPLARAAGSLFIERARRADVARLNLEVSKVLDTGVLVVLFPEGTSSDGSDVLPFKSSLLEPIVGQTHQVTAAHIRYELADGDPARDICYWGDMTFGPHLLNLLTKRRITASVTFSRFDGAITCRKELARLLHSEVRRLGHSSAITA